jgi:hypothetical protein
LIVLVPKRFWKRAEGLPPRKGTGRGEEVMEEVRKRDSRARSLKGSKGFKG